MPDQDRQTALDLVLYLDNVIARAFADSDGDELRTFGRVLYYLRQFDHNPFREFVAREVARLTANAPPNSPYPPESYFQRTVEAARPAASPAATSMAMAP
jgi:hypothetical protein